MRLRPTSFPATGDACSNDLCRLLADGGSSAAIIFPLLSGNGPSALYM